MKIIRYQNECKYIIFLFGEVFFVDLKPIDIKRIFRNIFLKYRDDSDCDGFAETWTDKLTNGKIYYAHGWSYTRVGGSFGYVVKWFDFR